MNEVALQQRLRMAAASLQKAAEDMPQVDCPVRHYFAPGMYCREMTIPEGVVCVGAVHKHEHLAILSKGKLRLTTEQGVVEFDAPAMIHSYPGIKRVAYAITEVVITTIHHNPTDTQDMEVITREHTDATADTLLGGKNNVQMLKQAERAKELT